MVIESKLKSLSYFCSKVCKTELDFDFLDGVDLDLGLDKESHSSSLQANLSNEQATGCDKFNKSKFVGQENVQLQYDDHATLYARRWGSVSSRGKWNKFIGTAISAGGTKSKDLDIVGLKQWY